MSCAATSTLRTPRLEQPAWTGVPEDQRQAPFAEMFRALLPGGRLLVADFRLHGRSRAAFKPGVPPRGPPHRVRLFYWRRLFLDEMPRGRLPVSFAAGGP